MAEYGIAPGEENIWNVSTSAMGDYLKGDGLFSLDSLLGGGASGGAGSIGGWGGLGLGIWQGLQAKKQFDLQEDIFNFQRDLANKNYTGQVRNYNMQVADRYRANQSAADPRNAYYGNRTTADELRQYGIKDTGAQQYEERNYA